MSVQSLKHAKYRGKLLFTAAIVAAGLVGLAVVIGPSAYGQDNKIKSATIKIDQFGAPPDSGWFFSSNTEASSEAQRDTLSVPERKNFYTYNAGPYEPDFEFNAIGVKVTGSDLDGGLDINAHLTGPDGTITRSLPPLADDVKEPVAVNKFVTKPVVVENVDSFRISVTLHSTTGKAPVVDTVEIIYLDTSSNKGFFGMASTPSSADKKGVGIISRKEWKADEDLRLNKNGKPFWPVERVDPEVFIIHHTAGTDGGGDPTATIRAIYYWHSKVLGWGDIGYNYLIDQQGNIYKGRYGKNGAVGGHTYNTVDDINYNTGSIGIALLGCFEEAKGACYSQSGITPEMETALAKLIGKKAAKNKIKPLKRSEFHGSDAKNVSGHQDLDYTYCPGNVVQTDLKTIRKKSNKRYKQAIKPAWRARMSKLAVLAPQSAIVQEQDAAALQTDSLYKVTVRYKNTGRRTWKQKKVRLKVYNKTGKKPSSLRHKSWPDSLGKIKMKEASVAPGKVATFTMLVKSKTTPKTVAFTTKLFNGKTKIKNSNATHELTFSEVLSGELSKHDVPVAMLSTLQQQVATTWLNTGELTWDETVQVALDGIPVSGFNSLVAIDGTGKANITLTAPIKESQASSESYEFTLSLQRNGITLPDTKNNFVVRID